MHNQNHKEQHYKQTEHHRSNWQVPGKHHPMHWEPVPKHQELVQEYGIQTYFKSGWKLKNILVALKDKVTIKQKSGVIIGSNVAYWIVMCINM